MTGYHQTIASDRLELVMRVPEFLNVAFVCMFGGTEDVVARADNEQELTDWMRHHGLIDHPRIIRYKITGADNQVLVEHSRQ